MTQIKLRRDTSANFTSKNPVLGVGEPAYETDTKKLKIGDGTTAYTQLEYFSAGGGGSTDISATLPLKIVDGVISLEVDGQTIQIVDGKLHANLDDKQDKFETQVPLSISSSSITTSVPTGITETTESWSGGGHDNLITVDVSALNVDANSDWKIHLSGYMGDYKSTDTNTNVLIISAEKNTIFRVWFGSWDFRLGNGTSKFNRIPNVNREFFYEIVHQKNGTEFIFNGTDLVDSSPLSISNMSGAMGSGTYTTLAGQGKLKDFSFLINSYQFQRIDRDITKSYFEADGVKYRFTTVQGTNTLNLNIGDGLSVVDGKLTASSTAPTNMVTTDTSQTITGRKKFTYGDHSFIINQFDGIVGIASGTNAANASSTLQLSNSNSSSWAVGAKSKDGYIYGTKLTRNDGHSNNVILDAGNLGSYVDGTTITYTNNKLTATGGGGSTPTNMVTTDTAQTITGAKTFNANINIKNIEGTLGSIISQALADNAILVGNNDRELILSGSVVKNKDNSTFLTSGNVTAYVIEEFVDGTEGYRVWSNGRCEQWGSFAGAKSITFLKNYADTNYMLLAYVTSKTSNEAYNGVFGTQKTTTGFTASGFAGTVNDAWIIATVGTCSWYSSGTLAS